MNAVDSRAVTAVIVNFHSALDTAALVANLEPAVNNILVVDNSGELDGADPAFGNAAIIRPPRNIGYGAAVNLAAEQVATRWLLVLNPDVRLPGGCLDRLLEAAQSLNTPLCGPRFYWDDACRFQLPPALGHPLWLISDRHMPARKSGEDPDLGALAVIRHERFWGEQAPFTEAVLSGACLLADLDWFRKNREPLFDETFFLYYEDTDLCGRLMRKGIMPVCVPDAEVVHYWNQSGEPPQGKNKLMADSERLFLQRYYPNGAPPLPPARPIPAGQAVTDLGRLAIPPTLLLPAESVLVDVGVQPDFLVFARTRLTRPALDISGAMWQRLRDGRYYLRAGTGDARFVQYWQFVKATVPQEPVS